MKKSAFESSAWIALTLIDGTFTSVLVCGLAVSGLPQPAFLYRDMKGTHLLTAAVK